ncbi:zinc finger protein 271 [Drosophila willistoni]|uniref:zinc finger protein 271 n=1 Tax=Drosophila willistoni TaxID=7260 RepID=UPI00017D96E6|nr:zinc finger protein 271 [Drosophila willistoni]
MTRICRVCAGPDGRFWMETPVEKYAGKTFSQLLFDLTKIEITAAQMEKVTSWICRNCAHKLQHSYDFVSKAKRTHEMWLEKMADDPICLRETPIHLMEIEGVTIKMEDVEPTVPTAVPCSVPDPLVRIGVEKRCTSDLSENDDDADDHEDDDDDEDDVPLKQRSDWSKSQAFANLKKHKCNQCSKAFKYITNLYRHKRTVHITDKDVKKSVKKLAINQEEVNENEDDNYYKCDQCDNSYKYVMLLVQHKQKVHGVHQMPSSRGQRAAPQQRPKLNTDMLVHSLLKAVEISDEDGSSSSDNYYKCDQCNKSYKYIVSLIKHKHKEHTENSRDSDDGDDQIQASTSNSGSIGGPLKTSRINRRVQDFDPLRCQPNGSKEIKCMICLRRFAKLGELRYHLKYHPHDFDFDAHGEPIERIAEGFFKTAVESTAEGLKRRIFKDLNMGLYGRYYSITNEARYELSLDSSDTDSDGGDADAQVIIRRSYACELCNTSNQTAVWPRKYQLHDHHRQCHTWLEAPHVCQRCDSRFLSEKLLEHHTSQLCNNTLKRYQCDKCPQRFFWRKNLRSHLVDHKDKQENYPCDQCQRSFQDKSSVTRHKLMMHADGKSQLIACRWCTRVFYRPALLHKHLQRHGFSGQDLPLAETLLADAAKPLGPKNIQCKICDLRFITIADLRGHMRMLEHDTQICSYMISTEAGFELQLDDTDDSDDDDGHTRRSYTCDLCHMKFPRRREMSEHQYSLHTFDKLPHTCDKCIYKTVDKLMLKHHQLTQCQNEEKKFICTHCGYRFMWQENLDKHLSSQHPKQKTSSYDQQTPSSSMRRKRRFRYQCPHCWRSFVVQPSLDKHIRDMHVAKKNPGKKYLCSLCGLESLTPNKLNIHMRRHMGEKPFKCDLCDMSFTVHYELKVHRRKHTGERPYKCTFCDKHFARPDKLRRHVYMHSDKR